MDDDRAVAAADGWRDQVERERGARPMTDDLMQGALPDALDQTGQRLSDLRDEINELRRVLRPILQDVETAKLMGSDPVPVPPRAPLTSQALVYVEQIETLVNDLRDLRARLDLQ